MTYSETLDYIFHKLPMYSRMGSVAYKKDLTNTRLLCDHLHNPQQKFPSIHVAGTNGKGSVSHMLAAIFQAAGYKTGLYTSPHLYDFRERIKVNGEMISESFVVKFIEELKPLIEKIEPSFFEITVAMAFLAFAGEKVDIAIIEVGLGGRLDSTNIIMPELSIITNIGWDHMNILGNSLEEIATEKAGIIKEKVPVVIGETVPETKPIFEHKAKENDAAVSWAEDNYKVANVVLHPESLSILYQKKNGEYFPVETDMPGIYQVQNVRTVLTAVDVLASQWLLPNEAVLQGLKEVRLRTGLGGRWEVIAQHPTTVLEVAHNEAGVAKMLEHISRVPHAVLHLIIGMVKDKEVDQVLQLLPASARYYFTQAHIPRALPAGELKRKGNSIGLDGESYPDVNDALQAATGDAGANDLVVVCGSIFLVAEVSRS
jgi:dihydrofolate synthase/folylpolyglutamate synthase